MNGQKRYLWVKNERWSKNRQLCHTKASHYKRELRHISFEMNSFIFKYQEQDQSVAVSRIVTCKENGFVVNVGAGPFGKEDGSTSICLRWKNVTITYDCRKKLPFTGRLGQQDSAANMYWNTGRVDEAPKFLKDAFGAWRQEECWGSLSGPGAFCTCLLFR